MAVHYGDEHRDDKRQVRYRNVAGFGRAVGKLTKISEIEMVKDD